ncbi:MAG: DegT/DnrJ/EryC1/StrS family aminotransferase, partial [Thermodesulfovibrionales bacterium]|nr:DegT/DnrJ/EryC1/StrS family aminotransferase [Thermodesulfovibrionales bacterium]
GTDALHLALKALGIGPGDEVITTPFTFFATAEAIIYEGAVPVFVDIEPDTFNIDVSAIEASITKRTKAILPVHVFGHPADMPAIMGLAKKHGLAVIEDCAQSFGATINGEQTGSIGDAGCFSFYPSKNLGACGDGGLVTVRDAAVADTIRSLRNHGFSGAYRHDTIGFNSRLDEIQAAILLIKLKHITRYNDLRREKARKYNALLGDKVRCPVERQGCMHVYHQYTITLPERDRIKKTLADAEISSMVYYPIPLHLQPALSGLGYKEGDFPVAERAAKEVLSLPICPELEEDDIARIAGAITGA